MATDSTDVPTIPAREISDPSSSSSKKKRFLIKKWNAVCVWQWDSTVDNCAICKRHILDLCIVCENKMVGGGTSEDCPTSSGRCGHTYHLHCISDWLKTYNTCPLDHGKWEFLEQ